MSSYYKDAQGLMTLLRPMTSDERSRFWGSRQFVATNGAARGGRPGSGCTRGRCSPTTSSSSPQDLGKSAATRHRTSVICSATTPTMQPLPEALERALERARREMNGGGIWRNAGPGANPYEILVNPKQAALAEWKAKTLAVLRKHLEPAPGSPRTPVPVSARLPVLSPSDRRAFLRATWSPFLPEAEWAATAARPEGRAQVYLDVSGSMNAEMPLIVALLGHLSSWIRRPFWAFSTEVVPAVIERGALRAGTSGGTSLECALEHIAKTRPSCAVIVTDGYIEQIPKRRVAAIAGHAPARHRHARRESVAAQGRGDPLLAAREVAEMIRVSEAVLPGHPDKLCHMACLLTLATYCGVVRPRLAADCPPAPAKSESQRIWQ